MTHTYQPDPRTGQCQACPPRGTSGCLWCSHGKGEHTGSPDPVVLTHYATEVPGPTGPVKSSRVRWTPTACGARHCACRTYEVRGR